MQLPVSAQQTPPEKKFPPPNIFEVSDNDRIPPEEMFQVTNLFEVLYSPQQAKAVKSERVSREMLPGENITLERTVELADLNNLQLKIAYEKVNQAIIKYKQAETDYNPRLNLEAVSALRGPASRVSFTLPMPPTFQPTTFNIDFSRNYHHYARLSLEYVMLTFGKIENNVASAYINIQAERENYLAQRQEVVYSIKESFFNILKSRSGVEITRDYVGSSRDHLKTAQSLYKQGIVSKMDVVKAELAVSRAETELVSSEKNLLLSRAVLLTYLNLDTGTPFDIISPFPVRVDESLTPDELKKISLANRREIKAMEENILSAQAILKAVKCGKEPDVFISANYDRQTASAIMSEYEWQVALGIKIPLYDGDVTLRNVEEAESLIKTLELSKSALESQIKLEVEKAWLDLKTARTNLKTADKNVDTARQEYRMAKVRYENGLSTSLEMEDALRSLHQAQQEMVISRYDQDVAFAGLEKALGVEIPDRRLNREVIK